jgi:hypothetical protein
VKRSAAASFALAAAGMLYSRLGGRRQQAQPAEDFEGSAEQPASSAEDFERSAEQPAPSTELNRARSELADELRRRASRPPADG